ncbi:MAG: DNA-3-methyladenine glycosylase I [Ruminococcaceae bacterium]|nr:DNA-3-methyladenine glycosylase I [Oscillospiraceae bacterium]
MTVSRCRWCNLKNPIYVKYHDGEWGTLRTDDAYLFEMLLLESFQSGLSWECVLNKREAFRRAFDGFDAQKISEYTEEKLASLAEDKSIIRNRRKIRAAVTNAAIFLDAAREFGSFYDYIRSFAGDNIIIENDKTSSPLSDAMSRDLRRRGGKFLGTTVVYSYLQAVGIINSHEDYCYLASNCR